MTDQYRGDTALRPDPTHCVLRVTGPEELIHSMPCLLGFVPQRSVVVLYVMSGRVVAAARYDLDCPLGPDLDAALHPMTRRFPGARVILIGVGDRDEVDARLPGAAMLFDPARIQAVLGTDWTTWWSATDAGPLPERPPAAVVKAARAVGIEISDRREDLVERYRGPDAGEAERLRPVDGRVRRQIGRWTLAERCSRCEALIAAGRRGCRLSEPDLVLLAGLVSETAVRDDVLGRITRRSADEDRAIWDSVVRVALDDSAPQVLSIAALLAWLVGDGVAMVTCVERALRIDPGHGLAGLLQEFYREAIDPTLWEEIRRAIPDAAM